MDNTEIEGYKDAILSFPQGKSDDFGEDGCLLGLTMGYSEDNELVQTKFIYNTKAEEGYCMSDGVIAVIVIAVMIVLVVIGYLVYL